MANRNRSTSTDVRHISTSTDLRHIVRRRRVWYFQRGVPAELQAHLGCRIFSRSLQTRDLAVARQRRDRLNLEFEAMLASLRPEVEDWSPRGVIQTARYLRLDSRTEVYADERAEISTTQTIPLEVTSPALVHALEQGERIVAGALSGTTLSEAISEHLTHLAHSVVPSTVASRRRHLDALTGSLGDVPVAGISRRDLARWVSSLLDADLAPGTRKNMVAALSAFGGWLVDTGHWVENHAAGLSSLLKGSKRGQTTEASVRAWTVGEVRDLLGHIDAELEPTDPLAVMVRIALFSGMRREEIAQLRGRDVEVIDGITVLQVRQGKTRSAIRAVPVHSAIRHLVADVEPNAYVVPGLVETEAGDGRRGAAIGARFSRLKTGWNFASALTFHGFRRSFVTRLETAGVAQNVAESIVGHARRSQSFGTYSRGADLPVLARAVEQVAY